MQQVQVQQPSNQQPQQPQVAQQQIVQVQVQQKAPQPQQQVVQIQQVQLQPQVVASKPLATNQQQVAMETNNHQVVTQQQLLGSMQQGNPQNQELLRHIQSSPLGGAVVSVEKM